MNDPGPTHDLVETHQTRQLASHALVESNLQCAECQYVLHGLEKNGTCPECGLAIISSINAQRIDPLDYETRQRVGRGCRWLVVSLGCTVAVPLVLPLAVLFQILLDMPVPILLLIPVLVVVEHLTWPIGLRGALHQSGATAARPQPLAVRLAWANAAAMLAMCILPGMHSGLAAILMAVILPPTIFALRCRTLVLIRNPIGWLAGAYLTGQGFRKRFSGWVTVGIIGTALMAAGWIIGALLQVAGLGFLMILVWGIGYGMSLVAAAATTGYLWRFSRALTSDHYLGKLRVNQLFAASTANPRFPRSF